jgi:hypothetical protein
MAMSRSNLGPEVHFNREKFLAAIHHIIAQCSDRTHALGKTKLHKSLYYSDMLHFFVTGEAITGVEYIKAPFGPTARYLDWGLQELSARGLISVEMEDYFGLGKYKYVARSLASSALLSERERALIGEVVEFVCEHSAREISEFSHAQPWLDARMGERISYASAHQLVPGTAPTQADREWARDQDDILQRYRRRA